MMSCYVAGNRTQPTCLCAKPSRTKIPKRTYALFLSILLSIVGCATDSGARVGQPVDTPSATDLTYHTDTTDTNVILPTDAKSSEDIQDISSAETSECPPKMAYIPAGSFIMGDLEGNPDAKIQHEVFLDAYCMDIYEVSVADYQECVNAGACADIRQYALCFSDAPDRPNSCLPDRDTHPVNYVSWNVAHKYCVWAQKALPTEAQWENAARGSDFRSYPWGEKIDCNVANWGHGPIFDDCGYDGPGTPTAPVDSFGDGASFYGLLHMGGNVDEWVADWYDPKYYETSPADNPLGPRTGDWHVFRGGSFSGPDFVLLSYWRQSGLGPGIGSQSSGFRCATMPVFPAR